VTFVIARSDCRHSAAFEYVRKRGTRGERSQPMSTPLIVVGVLVLVAAFYVILPIMAHTYRRYRGTWVTECPASDTTAEIAIDAKHAALTSAVGAPDLRVVGCSHWPAKEDCNQECIR
jgi:hypothetical protein